MVRTKILLFEAAGLTIGNEMANGFKQPLSVITDQTVGLRSWGLILYGALPANITVLGTLQQNIEKADNLLYLLLGVSVLPLLLTFLLIRSRHREWYLTYDRLFIRSAVTTLLIVFYASLISGISGIIYGKYVFSTANMWNVAHRTAIAESFLLGIGSLVISSTLFIAFVTKNSELPGLPSPKLLESLATVREKLRHIQASSIWNDYLILDDGELKEKAEEVKDELEKIFLYSGHRLTKRSLAPINIGITCLIEAIELIQRSGNETAKQINWEIYFVPADNLSDNQKLEREVIQDKYVAVQNIRQLKLGS